MSNVPPDLPQPISGFSSLPGLSSQSGLSGAFVRHAPPPGITRDAHGVAHCPYCGATEFDFGVTVLRMLLRLSPLWRMLISRHRARPKPYSTQVQCRRCHGFMTWDDRGR